MITKIMAFLRGIALVRPFLSQKEIITKIFMMIKLGIDYSFWGFWVF